LYFIILFFTYTSFPNQTCIEALKQYIGYINTTITWNRVVWNDKIASMYRYGDQSSNLADLITISENLHESINIGFKYIDNKSCTLGEAGVNGYKGCILKKLASEN
jgi:hypothetical protein